MASNVTITIVGKDKASEPIKNVGQAVNALGRAADQAKGHVSSFGQVVTGALRRAGEIATNALVAASQAFVGFIGSSIKGAADYESSMNMLQAVSGATGEEMRRAGELAKQLGADMTLPATSAASAGAAMTELAKAGLSVDQAMAAAKGTLQLAAAGGLEEAQAAEIAANALNAFGLAGSEAVAVADLLAASANASSIEVTDAADAMKMAGAVFSAFQGPTVGAKDALIDLTTAISIMGNAGIKGSDAGTSLKQVLLQLTGPSDKAKKLMGDLAERIGVSGDIAFDSSGKMRSLRDIVDLTARATADMTDEQRSYALTTIFGADASRAMIVLMKQGVEGWDKMRGAVTRQNAAAELAAARMQGLNGAAAGLSSQIETLALEALEPLLPIMTAGIQQITSMAGSLSGKLGPSVQGAIDFLTTAGQIIADNAIPALTALAGATLVYAVTSLPALVASLGAATGAFAAKAVAMMASLGPYALVAAAVYGVVKAYEAFSDKVASATTKVLESREWWNASTDALNRFSQATGEAKAQLEPYAASIQAMREQIQGEIDDLGRRMAAGAISREEYAAEMEVINQHTEGLRQATSAYDAQEAALIRQQAAGITATAALNEINSGEQALLVQTQLTAEELAKFAQQIEENFQAGAEAVGEFVAKDIEFIKQLSDARQKGYDEDFTAQALAYAQQSAAQRAHLGTMLTDYTLAQVQIGNITAEQGENILEAISRQFGAQESLSAQTYLRMTSHIHAFASSGSSDVNALGSDLDGLMDDAVNTQMAMDALAKQYTAELVQNFKDGKIDADELRDSLARIPSRVYSEVTITETTVKRTLHEDNPDDRLGGRAHGGPVMGGTPYIVGERGPEIFVPNTSGTIIPNHKLGAATGGPSITVNYTGVPSDERDVYDALRLSAMLMGG